LRVGTVVLLEATGSMAHVDHLRKVAAKNNLTFTSNGLSKASRTATVLQSHKIIFKTEAELSEQLGMQYVPPELRKDEGEIEAALADKLPEDLVTLVGIWDASLSYQLL
jgi:DNA polymerase (family 10)